MKMLQYLKDHKSINEKFNEELKSKGIDIFYKDKTTRIDKLREMIPDECILKDGYDTGVQYFIIGTDNFEYYKLWGFRENQLLFFLLRIYFDNNSAFTSIKFKFKNNNKLCYNIARYLDNSNFKVYKMFELLNTDMFFRINDKYGFCYLKKTYPNLLPERVVMLGFNSDSD